jgi:hypothetical protein
MSEQMLDMLFLATKGAVLLGTRWQIALIHPEQIAQSANQGRRRFSNCLAIRQDERARIGVSRHLQATSGKET